MSTRPRSADLVSLYTSGLLAEIRVAVDRFIHAHLNSPATPGDEKFMRQLEAQPVVVESPMAALRRRYPMPPLAQTSSRNRRH